VSRHRRGPVVLLETANGSSGIANAVVMITIPWLVLERTGSAAVAGLVVAVASLPAIVAAPVVGYAIDRLGRRPVSIVSDILSAISVAAFPVVGLMGNLTAGWILLLAVVGATFDPAGYTARRALIPDVASASATSLDRLNGIHEGVFTAGWTIGPLLAAGLIATVGAVDAFWAPFGLFLLAVACIVALRVGDAGQAARRSATRPRGTHWHETLVGARLLWRDKALRALTIAITVLVAVYLPIEAVILPTYFERLSAPEGLGIVISALAAGSVVGAFGYGWISRRMTRYHLARLMLVGTVFAIIPMALLPPLPLMTVLAFGLGLVWGPMNPLMSTLIQARIPADAQGRAYGIQLSLYYAAPPLAILVTGWSIERFGIQGTYLVLAGVLVVTALGVLFVRSIRDIDA
jgi:MFS family permease